MDEAAKLNRLSLEQFRALLNSKLGPKFGAYIDPTGKRRIWYEPQKYHRRFEHGSTWAEVWLKAWKRWVCHMPYVAQVDEKGRITKIVSVTVVPVETALPDCLEKCGLT